ncbi:uncharacterized protein LOC129590485 isoform X2 [Paramacrobiotus metropolitanus]|nr:uncharacterized protein LOC129590485 isoform X2 [Paramacrobiotus metropolitanus]
MSVDEFSKLIDRNIQYVRWGIAGIGVAGLIVIARSVRIVTKFTDAKNIPPGFFMSNISLHGRVKNVDDNGILFVDHIPIIRTPWSHRTDSQLRVRLAVVAHTPPSLKWLQTNLVGRPIFFQLLGTAGDGEILSRVKWQRFPLMFSNLNLYLIKAGLAHHATHPTLVGTREYELLNEKARSLEQLVEHKKRKRGLFGTFRSSVNALYRKWI